MTKVIGVSASASVLPMNIQGWFPLRLTILISLQSKGFSSLFQHHNYKASVLWCSVFFMIQLSHQFMTTGKIIALTVRTFVGKVMSWLFNTLSRLVRAFLPRSKCFFNFRAAVIVCSDFGSQENKICHCFHFFTLCLPWGHETGCHGLSFFLNVEFPSSLFTLLFHLHKEAL